MTKTFAQLIKKMTHQEQREIETFAAFIIARRNLKNQEILTDDTSTQELMRLVEKSGSFDWLDSELEDVYSVRDGDDVLWPTKS
ncbi:hypothetical protein H8E88_33185 [candidate division KSB1 bacterium]|nr:hypothetical protein [candidate division KSB1 bacterium]MBL7094788.1 hypothetical protein [candidate division KSB1 bacterium]